MKHLVFMFSPMKINNKILGGLARGTLGITIVGAFNGTTELLGLASITGGVSDYTISKTTNREKEIETSSVLRLR